MEFSSDKEGFFRFVDDNLSAFRTGKQTVEPQLKVKVLFDGTNFSEILQNKIAHNLYVNKNQIFYIENKGFHYKFVIHLMFKKRFLKVCTNIQQTFLKQILEWNESSLRIKRLRSFLYQLYASVMRNSIHLPLLFLLEKQGFLLLHGSCVANSKECLLFLGAAGIGKTALALDLVYNCNYKFLSDDFLLIKSDYVYSFPERLRVPKEIMSYLHLPRNFLGEYSFTIFGKYHVALPAEKTIDKSIPTKIFFVCLSNNFKISKLDALTAKEFLRSIHDYLHEFPRYSYLGLCPYAGVERPPFSIDEFLEKKDLYLLHLSPDMVENIKRILKYIDLH
jgi:hypothetical protein